MKKMKQLQLTLIDKGVLGAIISFLGINNGLCRHPEGYFLQPVKVKMPVKRVSIYICLMLTNIMNLKANVVNLSATSLPEGNKLEWQSYVGEVQITGYVIERKIVGDDQYTAIDEVQLVKEQTLVSYRFFDNCVSGSALYRLKIMSEFGEAKYSPEILVERQLITLPVSLCPQTILPYTANVKLLTASGKSAGVQVMICQNNQCQIDISNLTSGIYVIQISTGHRKYTQRIHIKK